MKEPAAGENFGGLVVVKLLRDNLVELILIKMEFSAKTISSQNINFFFKVPLQLEIFEALAHHKIARRRRKV